MLDDKYFMLSRRAQKKKRLLERCLPTLLPWQLQASVIMQSF